MKIYEIDLRDGKGFQPSNEDRVKAAIWRSFLNPHAEMRKLKNGEEIKTTFATYRCKNGAKTLQMVKNIHPKSVKK